MNSWRRPRTLQTLLSSIGVALPMILWSMHTRAADPCEGFNNAIVVITSEHALYLCEQGQETADYHVSLGRGGVGKTTQGDLKTPLGSYPLSAPYASLKFHTFIPVGYPTPEQVKQGYTGGDIGIHGPPRLPADQTTIASYFDWTEGCIAVGDDPAIDQIAAWVRRHKTALIHLF